MFVCGPYANARDNKRMRPNDFVAAVMNELHGFLNDGDEVRFEMPVGYGRSKSGDELDIIVGGSIGATTVRFTVRVATPHKSET